jgi:hypothetical protein
MKFSTGMITKQKLSSLAFRIAGEDVSDMQEDAVVPLGRAGTPSPAVLEISRDTSGGSGNS